MLHSRSVSAEIFLAAILLSSITGCDKFKHKTDSGPDASVTITTPADAAPAAPASSDSSEADAAPPPSTTASATHTTIAPGTTPVGTFSGIVKEGSIPPYTITLVLSANGGGNVAYGMPFGCKGTWSQLSHDTKGWRYKEHIVEQSAGGKKCSDGETALLEEVKPGVAYNYSEGSARGSIAKH